MGGYPGHNVGIAVEPPICSLGLSYWHLGCGGGGAPVAVQCSTWERMSRIECRSTR